jgi:hypothetical protein
LQRESRSLRHREHFHKMKSMTVQPLVLSIWLFFPVVVAVLQDSISDHFEGKLLNKVYAVDSFVEDTIKEWVPMDAY